MTNGNGSFGRKKDIRGRVKIAFASSSSVIHAKWEEIFGRKQDIKTNHWQGEVW